MQGDYAGGHVGLNRADIESAPTMNERINIRHCEEHSDEAIQDITRISHVFAFSFVRYVYDAVK